MVGFTDVFLSEVEQRLPVEKHARILLVSHAAPVVALARGLVGDKDLPFRPGCCSLTEIVPKDGGWAVAVLGGGAHLSETSTDWRPWGFVDLESNYGKVSDVRSCAVTAFLLMCGSPIFRIIPIYRKFKWMTLLVVSCR
jgi:transcription factor C subunit 7